MVGVVSVMKLRYAISPRSQILYIHGRDPQFLSVEYEDGYAFIWIDCDTHANSYPRAFDVHDPREGLYRGRGTLIPSINPGKWYIYDCGPGSTEEFNRVRWPNVAPMPLRGEDE